ncbi:MAG: acylneuraminate cytidylyltransferase family protein [Flavobacteriaceae bacterium TMED238]|nr:MAG: acylneuraminate cytidylyltransferase family protein [Flavobacteriaceae bacterium TMED238]|tara:strand:+ start:4719 stop:5417 length:699 start_codon:yes stop_codon:yes gene_type:complete
MTKTLCLIPARKGSKGLKNKNIKKLCGLPLLSYSFLIAKKIDFIDDIAITSDSKKYLNIIKDKKVIKILRPKNISNSKSKILSVINHTLKKIKKKYDYLLLLEPTSPLTDANEIVQAYNILIKNKSKYDFVVSVVSLPKYNSYFSIKMDKNKTIKNNKFPKNTNRQILKKEYFLSGNFYLAKTKELIKNQGWISKKTFGFNIKKSIHTDIDNKLDFLLAKTILDNGLFKKIK